MTQQGFRAQLPNERLESTIGDLKRPYTPPEAVAEANRCLYCHDAPCIQACPTGIDIPEFIRNIASGNPLASAKVIFESNILGVSCARVCPVEVLCVGSCVYVQWGRDPIQIGKLQRYSTDLAVEKDVQFFEKGPSTGKKVALIGAGPASLSCAHELTKLGYDAVIYEGRDLPGGLNTTGCAPYKIRGEAALGEVDYVQKIGFEIRTGEWIGKDVTFDKLEKDFDAIFIGVGLGPDSRLPIPGADLKGVVGAVELVEKMKTLEKHPFTAKSAVVVGGGNTAIDLIRELKKLGCEKVTMVYRRSEDEMPGYHHELEWAKKEGVEFKWLSNPVAIEGNGHVERVKLVKMRLGAPDDSGRRSPEPVPGSEFTVEADLVVEAVGQEKLAEFLGKIPGIELAKGRVKVDPKTHRTTHAKYFAGGDCVNGGKEVVNAVQEGKIAARGIHSHLSGKSA